MSENKIIEGLPAPRYLLVFLAAETFVRNGYFVSSAVPDEKGFKLTFEQYPGKNGQVSDAMIDAITASMTFEDFKRIYGLSKDIKGAISDKIYIHDSYSKSNNPQIIWDNREFSYLALWIANSLPGYNTSSSKYPLARIPFGATKENGGLYLSRLIALMTKYNQIACNIVGADFVKKVLAYNRNLTALIMTTKDPETIPEEKLKPSNDIYIDYSSIRRLAIALEKADEENKDKSEISKYCLARNTVFETSIYNTKKHAFTDGFYLSYSEAAVPAHEIDKFTMRFNGAMDLDRTLNQYGTAEYYIASWDDDACLMPQFEPLYKVRSYMFPGIDEILEHIDSHGFYAGSDDNHTLLKMIREYGYHIMNYENINSSMPFVSTYPYISYDDIRVMMREIIKQKEEVTPSVNQSLNIKPDYQSGT